MSQITTHVLNTMTGKPAEGILIVLEEKNKKGKWSELASGITDNDGRISNLLSIDRIMEAGVYRMTFEVKTYFDKQDLDCFYPNVPIVFEIKDQSHYHIPLLLSAFGYSTYRGS